MPKSTAKRKSYFNPLRPCGRRLETLASAIDTVFDFNPLRPCGRRLSVDLRHHFGALISIHSARVGGDPRRTWRTLIRITFQSTPPVWAETKCSSIKALNFAISIHSARVGGDIRKALKIDSEGISIHSARVGGDGIMSAAISNTKSYFNPLRPCGRRHTSGEKGVSTVTFQSTPPVWAETIGLIMAMMICTQFQSTPPVWAETAKGTSFLLFYLSLLQHIL